VQERLGDLVSLSSQLAATLDTNDQTTFKESVNDTHSRLNVISTAAHHRERSLLNSVAMWNDFQVCRSPLLCCHME